MDLPHHWCVLMLCNNEAATKPCPPGFSESLFDNACHYGCLSFRNSIFGPRCSYFLLLKKRHLGSCRAVNDPVSISHTPASSYWPGHIPPPRFSNQTEVSGQLAYNAHISVISQAAFLWAGSSLSVIAIHTWYLCQSQETTSHDLKDHRNAE